jgi:hypothetical protein
LIGPLYPNSTGMSSLQGSYSVLLQTFGPNYPLGAPALSQTALIPAGTRSITFVTTGAPGDARVTLNEALIPLFALGSGLLGGDVTAYAGQQSQVTFSTSGGWLLFDDVRFSSVAVPEPSSLALARIGIITLVLAKTRWSTMRCSKRRQRIAVAIRPSRGRRR